MDLSLKKNLKKSDLKSFESDYLHNGRKQEEWQIEDVVIDGKKLYAKVKMTKYYKSETDSGQFHLTIFSMLEFLSELTIIYAHILAGLKEKSREGWMLESNVKGDKAIRNPDNINVEMEVVSVRKAGVNIIGVTKSKVFDENGSFEATLKAFLS
jgi:hypothetical protein